MTYTVTSRYKESANCRLEANYAHQRELDMIPLMMEQDYKANGWRKSLSSVLHFYTAGVMLLMWDVAAHSWFAFGHAYVLSILSCSGRYEYEVSE